MSLTTEDQEQIRQIVREELRAIVSSSLQGLGLGRPVGQDMEIRQAVYRGILDSITGAENAARVRQEGKSK